MNLCDEDICLLKKINAADSETDEDLINVAGEYECHISDFDVIPLPFKFPNRVQTTC